MTITYRPFSKSDIPALVEIANIIEAQQNDPGRTSAESLQQLVAAPHIHAEEDFLVALADDNVIGGSLMMMRPNSGVVFADISLHPVHQAKEVVARLIEHIESRTSQRATDELPDDIAVVINFAVRENKAYVRSVLETTGYQEVRRQYVMRIALDTPIEQPTLPYEFRPFDQVRDAQAVHAVFQECFADHWGGVGQISFEEWAHQFESPLFDPTLFYILYHNHEIAAICLCELSSREDDLGLVEVLGVRTAYRKNGLGGLLLRHAFYQFQQRGYAQVGLDVDAENQSNAVALYEKAGMSVYRCTIAYCKVLRGNPAEQFAGNRP